jgi:hypothetical protein
MRWGQEEQERRARERRANLECGVGASLFILGVIFLTLGLLKSVYMQPRDPFSAFGIRRAVNRLIDSVLQEYQIFSFVWGLVPAVQLADQSFWIIFGFIAIGALLSDRGRRMRRVIQEARWASPYLRRREGIETIVNIGALPESRWQRFVRAAEALVIEVIAGAIVLLIGLHSCFNRQ